MKGERAEGLATMSPGPELAAVLAGLSPSAVMNGDTVEVMRAWSRQRAHVEAGFLQALQQVARSSPFSGADGERPSVAQSARRLLAAGEWAAAEVAAALHLTHRAAEREVTLAEDLVERLPLVFDALRAGSLDRARGWVFADVVLTADLTEEQIEVICEALVPPAGSWTTGQLRRRLVRMIMGVDPGFVERRYRAAVRDRGVFGFLGPDGTGTVTAFGLAAEDAVAACERLDALAARIRRAGHPGLVGQIRADLFVGLLDGRFEGFSSDAIVAAMLAEAGATKDGSERADASVSDADLDAYDAEAADAAGPDASDTDSACPVVGDSDTRDLSDSDVMGDASRGAGGSVVPPTAGDLFGSEIRVGLATLLGRDDQPAEVPGKGLVLPGVARRIVRRQHASQWRFAVTDPDGYLLLAGPTRHRPAPATNSGSVAALRPCRGGLVELHIPATLLAELAATPTACGGWADVVADIAAQYARRADLTAALGARPDDRIAHTALRRHVQIRDRSCVAPGCMRPASLCELDHTIDHATGGRSVPENSGPLCLRHHTVKHQGRWRLDQPRPGRFRWTSPLGQTYRCRGEPVSPPPIHPVPRPAQPVDRWTPTPPTPGPTMHRPPPRPDPPPLPGVQPGHGDDGAEEPPPF